MVGRNNQSYPYYHISVWMHWSVLLCRNWSLLVHSNRPKNCFPFIVCMVHTSFDLKLNVFHRFISFCAMFQKMIALVVFLVLQHQALGVVDEWRYYTHRAGPDSVVTETSPDFSVADASSQESASRVVPGDSYEASATEDAGGKGQMDTDQVLELEEKLLKLLRSKVASNPDKLAASVLGLEAAEELLLAEEALPAIFQTIEKMYAGSKKKRTKTFQDE